MNCDEALCVVSTHVPGGSRPNIDVFPFVVPRNVVRKRGPARLDGGWRMADGISDGRETGLGDAWICRTYGYGLPRRVALSCKCQEMNIA